MMTPLAVMTWLIVKHFVCDFPLQTSPWMYANKGTYGHFGGIAHALVHGLGTWLVLGFWAGVIDAVVHYHVDWLKVNANRHYGLTPSNSDWFWILLGADQLAHMLTYIALVGWLA